MLWTAREKTRWGLGRLLMPVGVRGWGAAAVTTGSSWESSLSEIAHGEAAGRPATTRDHVFVDGTSNIPVRTEESRLRRALNEIPRDSGRLVFL